MDAHRDANNTQQHPAPNRRIESFRDDCLLFGDFNRPVFLEEMERFIWSASKQELAKLRAAIARRTRILAAHRGDRGRPRGDCDPEWILKAKNLAWQRIVDGWTLSQIAASEGTKVTENNRHTVERTLSRRLDQYAGIIWDACREMGIQRPDDDRLKRYLDAPRFQEFLWSRAALPFRVDREESKRVVLELIPRGPEAAVRKSLHLWGYLDRKSKNKVKK